MQYEEKAKNFATEYGYDDVRYLMKWHDFECYQPIYAENDSLFEGLPVFILANEHDIRLENTEEAFEILENLPADVNKMADKGLILENDLCKVLIIAHHHTENGFDGFLSDLIFNPSNYNPSYLTGLLEIFVDLYPGRYKMAIIGDYMVNDFGRCILEDELLTVLLNDMIIQINLSSKALLRHVNLDSLGCNIAICKVEEGYLIHGELEITMLNNDFNPVWTFSGKDIFVSSSGKTAFFVKKDRICLYDFSDNYYEIDFNGKVISEKTI